MIIFGSALLQIDLWLGQADIVLPSGALSV